MDHINMWLAVISVILTVLFGSISVVTAIVIAVWKLGQRFSSIEGRLARVESILNGHKE